MKMDKIARMKELNAILKNAAKAYYQDAEEIMSNLEYDRLYDELSLLEEETGTILAGSVTQEVGFQVVSELPRERHAAPMLSLDKTKDRDALKNWLNGHEAVLSWKMDGLTIVLTYEDGKLSKAVTRGNGETGEVITNNAKVFRNLPLFVPFKNRLVLRGEAVISYAEFERINSTITDAEAKYKNPRNLCSGSVRQLNNEITAERNVSFYAFSLVEADGADDRNSMMSQFDFLKKQGFDVVEHYLVDEDTILDRIEYFAETVQLNPIPSDGLVLSYEDLAYGRSLGRTAKFPRNAIAFKWADEMKKTQLLAIEWSPSRTGLINPIAVFTPVELEGTTVSRAGLHNVSIVKQLELGIGDTLSVYKANMIIPQISENHTRSGHSPIAEYCPACGEKTRILNENGVETLRCVNLECPAKKIKAFTLFVSRDAMNIDGISEATLEKLIAHGYLHEFADLFRLSAHREGICALEGFGETSFENMIASIDRARSTTLPRVIYAVGIPNIGVSNAKMLCKEFHYDFSALCSATTEDLASIDGIGAVIAKSFVDYMQDPAKRLILDHVLSEVTLETISLDASNAEVAGKTFVITGSLRFFENRAALKDAIEAQSGKVSGSVSVKTDYLINNDRTSSSSKNQRAKEFNVMIISEEDAMKLLKLPTE